MARKKKLDIAAAVGAVRIIADAAEVNSCSCVSPVGKHQRDCWVAKNAANFTLVDRLLAQLQAPGPATPSEDDLCKKWMKQVYDRPAIVDPAGEFHWESMLVGFLLAHGVEAERAWYLADKWPH